MIWGSTDVVPQVAIRERKSSSTRYGYKAKPKETVVLRARKDLEMKVRNALGQTRVPPPMPKSAGNGKEPNGASRRRI